MAHPQKGYMEINPNKPIGEIAVEYDDAIELFEKRNINYAFGGRQTLQDACEQAGIPSQEILSTLETMKHSNPGERALDWSDRSMEAIIDHIITCQHAFIRLRLAVFCKKSTELAKTVGEADPSVVQLNKAILDIAQHLEEHMKEEEDLIFPHLKEMEQAYAHGENRSNPYRELSVPQHPIAKLSWKHEVMWDQWVTLRKLTNDYQAPAGANPDFVDLCRGLKEFQEIFQEHGHLEDNILFRKAVKSGFLD